MKTILSLILIALSFSRIEAYGQKKGAADTTITFKVWGNCEMCKETIERAADIKGVKKAIWDQEKKMLTVTFNQAKTNEEELHKRIAAEGYDTEKAKGDDKVYATLPDCCRYERKK